MGRDRQAAMAAPVVLLETVPARWGRLPARGPAYGGV